jgi:hypothetical protein
VRYNILFEFFDIMNIKINESKTGCLQTYRDSFAAARLYGE